jgi:hypothetical protein
MDSKIAVDEGDLYLMVNVRPQTSGLPFIVWLSMQGNARRDARVKVSRGPRALPLIASVSIRPLVEVVEGELTARELELMRQWVDLNRDVIVRHGDGDLEYSEDVLAALRPLPRT